jgi:hypothetical protein
MPITHKVNEPAPGKTLIHRRESALIGVYRRLNYLFWVYSPLEQLEV